MNTRHWCRLFLKSQKLVKWHGNSPKSLQTSWRIRPAAGTVKAVES